jgi:hypothetical protein
LNARVRGSVRRSSAIKANIFIFGDSAHEHRFNRGPALRNRNEVPQKISGRQKSVIETLFHGSIFNS